MSKKHTPHPYRGGLYFSPRGKFLKNVLTYQQGFKEFIGLLLSGGWLIFKGCLLSYTRV
nr:MAG TPA: hypothetical protein [Caudoviricetes sp.]